MKKLLMIVSLVSAQAMADFSDNQRGGFIDTYQETVVTVVQALKAEDDTVLSLKGNILRRIDDDKFIFADRTGQITIEVEDDAWGNQNITPSDTITVQGKIDNEWHKATELEVFRIIKH